MRANNENLSVLRIYNDDQTSTGNLNKWKDILVAAGLISGSGTSQTPYKSLKDLKVRLIAVCWSASNATTANAGGATLEFNGDGSTFNIAGRSIKPVRTRVPVKDYIDGQFVSIKTAGVQDNDIIGSIGGVTMNYEIFKCDATVNFVDIAVRY